MTNILSLSKARKAKARDAREKQAVENRMAFGRTKGEKRKLSAEQALVAKRIDGHKRGRDTKPEDPSHD